MNKTKNQESFVFRKGSRVLKLSGDYVFVGVVVSSFRKINGQPRYVVENKAGLLHIFKGSQLRSRINTRREDSIRLARGSE